MLEVYRTVCALVCLHIFTAKAAYFRHGGVWQDSLSLFKVNVGPSCVTCGREAATLTGCRWCPSDRLPHQQPPAPPRALRTKIAPIMLLRVRTNCSGHFLAGCFLNWLNCPCALRARGVYFNMGAQRALSSIQRLLTLKAFTFALNAWKSLEQRGELQITGTVVMNVWRLFPPLLTVENSLYGIWKSFRPLLYFEETLCVKIIIKIKVIIIIFFFVKLLAWNLLHRHTAVSGLM